MKLAIKVFTPEEMIKLLANAKSDHLVALAVMGFAGIRAEEFKRLQWEHFDFVERHIIVPDSVAKCEERRIVPLPDQCIHGLTVNLLDYQAGFWQNPADGIRFNGSRPPSWAGRAQLVSALDRRTSRLESQATGARVV
jgi:integrase